jgi:hypothetical protein
MTPRLLTAAAAFLCLFVLATADDKKEMKDKDSKDSPLVASTRKKLEKVASFDFKDQYLADVLKELENEAECKFYLGTGVPRHKSITYSAKDKPIKVILDEMFKPHGLGYIVHRKEKDGDRYEGWVQVVQGEQRGDDTAAPTGKKLTKKDEDAASKLLTKAKGQIKSKKNDDAIKTLEELLEKYPESKVAAEAKKQLEKLKE